MGELLGVERSEQERLQDFLRLDVTTEKLRGIDTALGPGGIGTFVLRQVLDADQLEVMQQEIFDPHCITWRDNHDSFTNQRGLLVIENHTTYALKLSRGDQTFVDRVPHMRALAFNIQKLVRGLSSVFPPLHGYEIDEMSLHRYDDPEVGLSYHKDNLRFIGLIGVLTLEGESDVGILDSDGNETLHPVGPGDLNLTRATTLYDAFDENGRRVNLCPDHAVINLRTPHRTSFIVRANIIPNFELSGFEYANWVGEPLPKNYLHEVTWPAKS